MTEFCPFPNSSEIIVDMFTVVDSVSTIQISTAITEPKPCYADNIATIFLVYIVKVSILQACYTTCQQVATNL